MRRAAHNGCCRRVAQTRALCSVLWKLLVSEDLAEVLLGIEIPLVRIYEVLLESLHILFILDIDIFMLKFTLGEECKYCTMF